MVPRTAESRQTLPSYFNGLNISTEKCIRSYRQLLRNFLSACSNVTPWWKQKMRNCKAMLSWYQFFLLLQWHKTSVAIQSMWWATSCLFYLPAGIDTTAASIFAKLANNFSERGVTWSKCKTVPIDGARVMVSIRNGVVALIKQVAPEVVSRTGLSKWGARLEAILRCPTQCSAQNFLSRASSHNVRNRWCDRAMAERATQCRGLQACPLVYVPTLVSGKTSVVTVGAWSSLG